MFIESGTWLNLTAKQENGTVREAEVAEEGDTGLSLEMPLKEMLTWQMRKNKAYLQGRCGQLGRNALGLAEHGPVLLLHSDTVTERNSFLFW